MKKLSFAGFSLLIAGLVSCSTTPVEDNDGELPPDNNLPIETTSGSAMVVYFSATGNTEEIAQIIATHLNAPIYELEPVEPYTAEDLNYSDPNSRVNQERSDPNHITELVDADFEEFSESTYIFLGAPVWWGNLSFVINDFVLSNDFTGKTIIPFATASSSTFSVSNLKHLSEEATWNEGHRFTHSQINEEIVTSWVDGLGYNFN